MYIPKHFEETRVEVLHAFIANHPLGAWVVNGPQGLDANHVPFELDAAAGANGRLLAHVARANPVWQQLNDGDETLVIFRSDAQGYISPNWYPSKTETHRAVPTWNYEAVHVHGRVKVRDDVSFLRPLLERLTHAHETRAGEAQPWQLTHAPDDYIERVLAAVVGIEIEVTRMIGKFKLSQNREERDRRGAIDALAERGEVVLSDAMKGLLKC